MQRQTRAAQGKDRLASRLWTAGEPEKRWVLPQDYVHSTMGAKLGRPRALDHKLLGRCNAIPYSTPYSVLHPCLECDTSTKQGRVVFSSASCARRSGRTAYSDAKIFIRVSLRLTDTSVYEYPYFVEGVCLQTSTADWAIVSPFGTALQRRRRPYYRRSSLARYGGRARARTRSRFMQ